MIARIIYYILMALAGGALGTFNELKGIKDIRFWIIMFACIGCFLCGMWV